MDLKPKVIYIAGNIPLPTRSSNKIILDIAGGLAADYDISVIYPKEFCPYPINRLKKFKYLNGIPEKWEYAGISIRALKYIRLPYQKKPFAMIKESDKRLLKLLRSDKPRLVHAHYALPDGYMALTAYKRLGIPYIISLRKSDIENINTASGEEGKYRETLCNASAIIVHNRFQQEFLHKRFGADSLIIPHGIEESFLEDRVLSHKDDIVISAVGEMIRLKRFDWLIKAIKEYRGCKRPALRLIGDGPLLNSLKAEADNASNIQFYGRQPHDRVRQLLTESDIFALPSVSETFGLVYMEAAATKNAVVAVRDTGVWGNFEDGKEMLYIEDYRDFRDSLFRLIDDDELRIELAENAFYRVKKEYLRDTIIGRYNSLYQAIISEKNQSCPSKS